MDSLTEEIEKILRQEQDEDQCHQEGDRVESALYKGMTCLLNIMLLGIVVFLPVFAAIMFGSFLKNAGKFLFMKEKNRDGNP